MIPHNTKMFKAKDSVIRELHATASSGDKVKVLYPETYLAKLLFSPDQTD